MSAYLFYKWLSFENNKYVAKYLDSVQEHNISVSKAEDFRAIAPFFVINYSKVLMPAFNSRLLLELLTYAGIEDIDEFVTIGCMFQYTYSENYNIEIDDLLADFNDERQAYLKLFQVLENYIFLDNKEDLHSVTFKFNRHSSISIKNSFVIDDIYKALCIGYGLKKNNFHEIKEQILAKTNPFKVEKYDELVKTNFIQKLYEKVFPYYNRDSDTLRFIGLFCNIFEISINNNSSEIELYDTLEDSLSAIEIKNLKHYISRPPKFKH